MSSKIHIVGFTGSLRKQSLNQAALREAQGLLPEDAELEIIPLDNIPLFNQDYEYNEPEPVRILKDKIRKTDCTSK